MPWANGEFRNTSGKGRVRDPETDKRIAKSKPLPAIDNTYAPGEDLDTFEFLKRNPAFIDKPATIEQFIDEERYLGLGDGIRPAVRQALIDIFGDTVSPYRIAEKRYGIFTGAIGIGKSTLASIAMPYMAHWVLCLENPQKYFNLLKGRRIAFMLMSTTDAQAKEVLFGDIKANVDDSPWFLENAPRDTNYKNQIRFPKDVWIIPGNSQDTKFEGYNCCDSETQILTTHGWVNYDQLREGELILTLDHDTGMSEWQPVQRVNIHPGKPRNLILMEGAEFSALTTPDHRWATFNRTGTRRWRTTATLNGEDKIPTAALSADRPSEPKFSDALVEAVAWFYTEGSLVGKTGAVIYQKFGTKTCDRIRRCLTQLFGPPVDRFQSTNTATDGTPLWRENVNNSPSSGSGTPKGLSEFRLNRDAGQVLLEYAPGRVPTYEFLLSLTQAQLDMFLEVSMLADNRGPGVFAQKNHAMSEAFAFAAILAGCSVSIRPQWQPTATGGYDMLLVRTMSKRSTNPVSAAKKPGRAKIETVRHDGIVWCPTVRNSTWLARRRGSVYFTGNCLGGAIDEADSHKTTPDKDYAQSGYDTIENRITSRFGKAGLLLVIGQMKTSNGFASRTYKRMLQREDSAAVKLTLWESFGWQKYKKPDGTYDVFWFDIKRKEEVSAAMARDLKSQDIIPIPMEYHEAFATNPVKALRDLAGIPPDAEDPFIAVYERVESAMLRWHENHPDIEQPVDSSCINPTFHPLLLPSEPQKRVLHVDIAYSDAETADALGMAMGYVDKLVDIDGDWKPYIVYDFLLRVKARTGTQIMLADIRRLIYELIDERGYRIGSVTVDGTQSLDMIQTLQKRRINASYMSVDKIRTPYEDLRETIYERRCEFPAYITELAPATGEMVVIAAQELKQLEDTGKKIDHPPHGSKDVADAMAGVAYILHGSPQYRRGVARAAANRRAAREEAVSTMGPGYDENLADAVTPIDVDFYDETGELMRALGGLSGPRPTVPKGLPPLRDDPFGHIMLPSRNI